MLCICWIPACARMTMDYGVCGKISVDDGWFVGRALMPAIWVMVRRALAGMNARPTGHNLRDSIRVLMSVFMVMNVVKHRQTR